MSSGDNYLDTRRTCEGTNCPKLFQTSPSQFRKLKFVAACNYQIWADIPDMRREIGAFLFKGEQTLLGVIRREPSEFINEFTFRDESKTVSSPSKPPIFFRHEIYLQFPDAVLAEKKFKAPKPNAKSNCWEANATIYVTEMWSIFGWDNMEGDYPQKYSVLKIGQYRKCLNPTPDPFAQ